jgi:hypothetical protein
MHLCVTPAITRGAPFTDIAPTPAPVTPHPGATPSSAGCWASDARRDAASRASLSARLSASSASA